MSSTERVIAISQKIIECRKELLKLEEELQSLIKNSKYSVNPNEYGQTCQEICLNILKFAYPKSINFFQLRNMIKGYANGTISSRLSTLKNLIRSKAFQIQHIVGLKFLQMELQTITK